MEIIKPSLQSGDEKLFWGSRPEYMHPAEFKDSYMPSFGCLYVVRSLTMFQDLKEYKPAVKKDSGKKSDYPRIKSSLDYERVDYEVKVSVEYRSSVNGMNILLSL